MKCVKDYCPVIFKEFDTSKAHLKYLHNMKTNDDYICTLPECQKTFSRSDNFF